MPVLRPLAALEAAGPEESIEILSQFQMRSSVRETETDKARFESILRRLTMRVRPPPQSARALFGGSRLSFCGPRMVQRDSGPFSQIGILARCYMNSATPRPGLPDCRSRSSALRAFANRLPKSRSLSLSGAASMKNEQVRHRDRVILLPAPGFETGARRT